MVDLITNSKKVLVIDLSKRTAETGNYTNLYKYIGGVGLALKLYQTYEESDPIVIAGGPLSGFFPYASKTAVVLDDGGTIEDLYIGGSLASRLRFTGVDAVVILGKARELSILDILNTNVNFRKAEENLASLGLPGKRTLIDASKDKIKIDFEFTTHEYILEKKLAAKGITGIVITGTEVYAPKNFDKYKELYNSIMNRKQDITVTESNKPSCVGCPLGCEKSRFGEIGGNVLVHSLVACQYAEKIYSDLSVSFACLNSLGYPYTHEDLENLPDLVEETLKAIS